MKTYMISLDECYFKAILEGSKKYEFRKKFANVTKNFSLVIYISSPVKAIKGIALCGPIIKDKIEHLASLSIDRKENILRYFEGREEGYAIPIIKMEEIGPISLDKLKALIKNFQPPQSYVCLDKSYCQIKSLLNADDS